MKTYIVVGLLCFAALALTPNVAAAQCASAISCANEVVTHCGNGAILSQECSNAMSNLPEGAYYQAANIVQNLYCLVQDIVAPGTDCLVPEPCRPGEKCETEILPFS